VRGHHLFPKFLRAIVSHGEAWLVGAWKTPAVLLN
jgi:hypothetical protein